MVIGIERAEERNSYVRQEQLTVRRGIHGRKVKQSIRLMNNSDLIELRKRRDSAVPRIRASIHAI